MIEDACNFLRREIDEKIEAQTAALVRGTASRDEDQTIRGLIRGLNMSRAIVDDLEDRARRIQQE